MVCHTIRLYCVASSFQRAGFIPEHRFIGLFNLVHGIECIFNPLPGGPNQNVELLSSARPGPMYYGKLLLLVLTTPLKANRELWLALRWSLGGGVASTRSDGDCAKRSDFGRTAQAPPSSRKKRHPQRADWAGRKRQSYTAAPSGAVEDERRSMASNTNLVAVGGRSSKELDKKPIWLE